MKIYAEFIVMYEAGRMPDADKFCPSFWKTEDFDSDGDYYYDNIEGRWTELQLTKRWPNDRDSVLHVNTFREKRLYDPGLQEVADLQRYIDYHKQGRYSDNPKISAMNNLAVTSLIMKTSDIQDYQEFLETVHFFLDYTKGIVVNIGELDAASFQKDFLGD